MLSQINKKNQHVSKENVYITMWIAVYEYSKDIKTKVLCIMFKSLDFGNQYLQF